MDTKQKLSAATILLHWLVAIAIICMLGSGAYMALASAWWLYPIHKATGVIIVVLIVIRVAWRIRNGWPEAAHHYPKLEQKVAKVIHWVLLTGTVVMPVSGMLYSGASGHGFGIPGLIIVPANHDASNPGEVIPYSETGAVVGEIIHEWVGYVLIAAVVLHLAGALKHHFIDRDSTLRRMMGSQWVREIG